MVERGLELFGAPVNADAEELGPVGITPEEIRLVAYETLRERGCDRVFKRMWVHLPRSPGRLYARSRTVRELGL